MFVFLTPPRSYRLNEMQKYFLRQPIESPVHFILIKKRINKNSPETELCSFENFLNLLTVIENLCVRHGPILYKIFWKGFWKKQRIHWTKEVQFRRLSQGYKFPIFYGGVV